MPTYAFTVEAVSKQVRPGWSISAPINGVGTFRGEIVSADGSYVPALDDEILFTEDGVTIFGGNITSVRERGLGGYGASPIVSEITANDFNGLALRRYFQGGISSGTLKSILTTLVPYLVGASLDAAQVDGPTLGDLNFSAWLLRDILDHLATLTGYVWRIDYDRKLKMFVPGTEAASFNIAAGDGNAIGDVVSEPTRYDYANRVIVYGTGVTSTQDDAPAIAANGEWETLVQATDIADQTSADTLASAILASSLVEVKRVEYKTRQVSIRPGQTQTINLAARHINNTFLALDVETRNTKGNLVERFVKSIEGTVYRPGWREDVQAWGGSGGGTSTPGVGAPVTVIRTAYFLGASAAVRSSVPTWVDASELHVEIDSNLRGSLVATVKGRIIAFDAGNTVQARLRDVALGPISGTSSVISAPNWTQITFTVTLNAGSHFYVLQLLPGVADQDVAAVCYVE